MGDYNNSGSNYYDSNRDVARGDDRRDRSPSQDWGEDGSQVDDSRYWSDAGYNSSGDRYSGRNPHGRAPAVTAHIMNGETRFPTAMSYLSDAQRSDVATVCSGSVADETEEVESILSQEDQHQSLASMQASEKPLAAGIRRTPSGGSRGVEFADDAPQAQGEQPTGRSPVFPGNGPLTSLAHLPEAAMPLHSMGPPLNRALLLQRTEGLATGSDGGMAHHHTHSDGSVDMEPHWNQDDKKRAADSKPGSQAGSVKSYGSNNGSAHGDTDDCGGSLDVETHSIETRSIHSQDEAPNVEMSEAAKPDPSEESPTNTMLNSESVGNGRRSPGGTIYKGRGIRRYQGRYMHLPLKRFHQNGVHLGSVDEGDEPRNGDELNGFHDGHWEDPRRPRGSSPRRHDAGFERDSRSRSRSRSRSPPPAARTSHRNTFDDLDRKPAGRQSPTSPHGYRGRGRSPERKWSPR